MGNSYPHCMQILIQRVVRVHLVGTQATSNVRLALYHDNITGTRSSDNSNRSGGTLAGAAFRGGHGDNSDGCSGSARAALRLRLLAVRGFFADEGAFWLRAVRGPTKQITIVTIRKSRNKWR